MEELARMQAAKGSERAGKSGSSKKNSHHRTDSPDPLQVFDFTEAEEAVIHALVEHGDQSVSKLARMARLPRTTTYSVLKRLKERGIVRRKSKGYRSVWGLVAPPKLKKRVVTGLEHIDRDLTVGQLEEELGVKVPETAEFFVFRGIENMLQVYQWMVLNHFNQRVLGIQTRSSMESINAKLHPEKVAQLNDIVKDSKVIVDAILPESIQEIYRKLFAGKQRLAKSVEGRTMAAHLVSDKLLSFNSDLLIGNDVALLANWDEEALVLIRNADMVALLRCLFETFREIGKTFDHNALVRSIIAEAE